MRYLYGVEYFYPFYKCVCVNCLFCCLLDVVFSSFLFLFLLMFLLVIVFVSLLFVGVIVFLYVVLVI